MSDNQIEYGQDQNEESSQQDNIYAQLILKLNQLVIKEQFNSVQYILQNHFDNQVLQKSFQELCEFVRYKNNVIDKQVDHQRILKKFITKIIKKNQLMINLNDGGIIQTFNLSRQKRQLDSDQRQPYFDYEILQQLQELFAKMHLKRAQCVKQQEKQKQQQFENVLLKQQINSLTKFYQRSLKQLQNIRVELQTNRQQHDQTKERLQQTKHQLSLLIHDFQQLKKNFQKKQQENQELKGRLTNHGVQMKIVSNINNQTNLLNQLPQQQSLGLIQRIEQATSRKVRHFKTLYNHKNHSCINFHSVIDNKDNIILASITNSGKFIGGFTTESISLQHYQVAEKSTKAFIFIIDDISSNYYDLIPGRQSVIYDYDYIIFGNEELCIQNNKNQMHSYAVNGERGSLHYRYPQAMRQYLLTSQREISQERLEDRVDLKDYQILQVIYQQ